MMKKALGILLGLLFCFTAGLDLAAATENAADIMKKSDNAIFQFIPKKFMQRFEDYENQQYKRYGVFEAYVKGDERFLIVGIEPAFMKGIAVLRVGDQIFTYLKKVDILDQVSAKQSFGNSTFSEEDIVGGRLADFYNVDSLETVKENGKEFFVLTVVAKTKDVAYKKIVNYVDPVSYYPVKRLYYAFSGKQVKEMTFDEIGFKDGRQSLLKVTMYDSLRKGWFTKLTQYDFDYSQEVPDKMFTRMYLRAATK